MKTRPRFTLEKEPDRIPGYICYIDKKAATKNIVSGLNILVNIRYNKIIVQLKADSLGVINTR